MNWVRFDSAWVTWSRPRKPSVRQTRWARTPAGSGDVAAPARQDRRRRELPPTEPRGHRVEQAEPARLLPLQAEIAYGAGEPATALAAAEELDAIATDLGTESIRAAANGRTDSRTSPRRGRRRRSALRKARQRWRRWTHRTRPPARARCSPRRTSPKGTGSRGHGARGLAVGVRAARRRSRRPAGRRTVGGPAPVAGRADRRAEDLHVHRHRRLDRARCDQDRRRERCPRVRDERLRPSITHSSPSSLAVVRIARASEPGSVSANAPIASPCAIGTSHRPLLRRSRTGISGSRPAHRGLERDRERRVVPPDLLEAQAEREQVAPWPPSSSANGMPNSPSSAVRLTISVGNSSLVRLRGGGRDDLLGERSDRGSQVVLLG